MRAVLFDLGNTLVSYYAAADFAPILRKCLRGCMEVLADDLRIDENELVHRARMLNTERPNYSVWPLEKRLVVLFGDAARDIDTQERLTEAFLRPIFATAVVAPDALTTLSSLRARGVRTAIVSNTPWGTPARAWRAELARHNLLDAIDASVFCMDVGHRKPHSAPFVRALELLGVPAADAVFVGDDPSWDITGARGAGMSAILLTSSIQHEVPDAIPIAANLREVLSHVLAWPSRLPDGDGEDLAGR